MNVNRRRWKQEDTTMANRNASRQQMPEAATSQRRAGLASVREAEQFLNLSRATIYGLMDAAKLRYVKIGKSRRIPWDALDELVQKNTVGAT
jgi:excisionase family DNA binding protein